MASASATMDPWQTLNTELDAWAAKQHSTAMRT